MPKRLFVILSTAADINTDALQAELERHDFKYQIVGADNPPEAYDIVKKLRVEDYDALAVYGGDGTVIAVLKAAHETRIPILILPGGTANIIAVDLRLPSTIGECLSLLSGDHYVIRHLDVADVNGEPMVLDLHFGLWAEAIKTTPRRLKKRIGTLAYGWSAIKQLPKLEKFEYEIEVDGVGHKLKAYFLMIANQGYQNIFGLPVFSKSHGRGVVQIMALRTLKRSHLVRWLVWKWFSGRNLQSVVTTFRARQVVVKKAPESMIYDDDQKTAAFPLKVTAGPRAALVIAPAVSTGATRFHEMWLELKLILIRLLDHTRRTLSGSPDLEYAHVAPGLYLGGQYRPGAVRLFKKWGVTGIISMRRAKQLPAPEGIELLNLPTTDWEPPTLEAFRTGVDFIKRHIEAGGSVYVHCRLGEGRGPSMAAAYLISHGMRAKDAVHHLQRFRPFVRPNAKQIRQLARWQDEIN